MCRKKAPRGFLEFLEAQAGIELTQLLFRSIRVRLPSLLKCYVQKHLTFLRYIEL